MKRRPAVALTAVSVVFVCSHLLVGGVKAQATAPVAANGKGQNVGRPKESDFTHLPIASVGDLLELVKAVETGRLPERRLILKIENGGLSFDLRQADFEAVTNAHGSARVLAALKPLVKVEPPPKPPPAPGKLTISCEPVDCNIAINNQNNGRTDHGKSQPYALPAGSYVVKVRADRYQADAAEKTAEVYDGADALIEFHLHPTREALQQAGKDLFTKLASPVGGDLLLKNGAAFKGVGELELSDRDGAQLSWGVQVLFKAPGTAKFSLTRGGKKPYIVVYREGTYVWVDPPPESPSLEDVLIKLCLFQPANLISRFPAAQFKLETTRLSPSPDGDNVLSVSGTPESYVVTADSLFHVTEVQTQGGLNDGVKALYGEYQTSSNGVYPRTIQLVLPDRPRHGAEINFSEFIYNPYGITDKDFTVKSKK